MPKKKDLIVMAYLRQNARIKLTTLSKLTKLPVSTIFDRIRMNEGSLIKKHVSLLDFAGLGFSTKANIMLRVAKQDKAGIREFLEKHQNVNSLLKINNGFDFFIEGIFRNINELEEFLERLDEKFSVKSKEVHYIIDDIRREAFMSDPNLVGILIGDKAG
jgi:DNA-binding Lrp family transcriptional regulator